LKFTENALERTTDELFVAKLRVAPDSKSSSIFHLTIKQLQEFDEAKLSLAQAQDDLVKAYREVQPRSIQFIFKRRTLIQRQIEIKDRQIMGFLDRKTHATQDSGQELLATQSEPKERLTEQLRAEKVLPPFPARRIHALMPPPRRASFQPAHNPPQFHLPLPPQEAGAKLRAELAALQQAISTHLLPMAAGSPTPTAAAAAAAANVSTTSPAGQAGGSWGRVDSDEATEPAPYGLA
jgi:hypothetical protein